ncbi:putative methyltransferase NSUN7 [Microcaecilia unicolor]|uniref:Methyltransferase NSUN7 n=1 Tax=Microcaecilia unicolor TaxID=1415580 RepID=A0A6P7X418_9AMPH|nr:putative methyltransferase NSUN7 [Microcaecilia unicolor]
MLNVKSNMDFENSNTTDADEIPKLNDLTTSSSTEPVAKNTAFFHEKNNYPDHIFLNAAQIFQNIRVEKPPDKVVVKYGNRSGSGLTLPNFKDEKCQRWSYELAFSALKYQDLLENILLDSGLYPCPSIADDRTSLMIVILYDYQDRKFQPRILSNKEELIPEVQEIEHYLFRYKNKLAASLARCRIKYDALTIDHILPENVRKQEQRAFTLPLYAWINTVKTSFEDICGALKKEGYSKVNAAPELEGYAFCVDEHCPDVLVFPPHLREELNNLQLFTEHKLLLQDKYHSLAVHSVKALLNMDDDILVTNGCTGLTLAHMSMLTNQFTCNIFVCGIKSETKESELQELFARIECKNIKFLRENFMDIDPVDHRLQKAKIILLLPLCSGSGVSDPVQFILNEHRDAGLLQDFSQGSVAEDKLHVLARQQSLELTHATKFHKVQAIVYCTCSVYAQENENVVTKALEISIEGNKAQPYRLSPPVLPLCHPSEIMLASGKFFKMEPSELTNGCFLAVLSRERDPSETVSVKDVLARAAAKGLLEGVEMAKPPKREEKKKKSKTSLQKNVSSASVSQAKIAEFLNRESSNSNTKIPLSKPPSTLLQKNMGQINSNIQNKRVLKQITSTVVLGTAKNTNSLSSMSKVFDKQTNMKPKSEDKMIALKPVEIVLPPVLLPFYNSTGSKARNPSNSYPGLYRLNGVKNSLQNSLAPSLTILNKQKETLPFVVRHPRPWL